MTQQTITAVFSTAAEAQSASQDLAMKIGGVRAAIYGSQSDVAEFSRLGITGPDQSVLAEAIRRGHVVLSAAVPEEQFNAAADVIEAAGAVDLDAQEAEWRKTGWTDTAAMAPALAAVPTATAPLAATSAQTAGSLAGGSEETIPLVEESLRIGKRETSHGRVRIRSYVVETPVQEQVTLHQEHVHVDRRTVNRPVEPRDEALFQERIIEATETAEEAVVAKDVRVREEVVIRKTAEDQARTISDTVRRTEIEVDDDRQKAGATVKPVVTTDRNP